MTFHCPVCKRAFAEPGFCPFDGKQLVETAPANAPTVLETVPDKSDTQLGTEPAKLKFVSAHEGHADAVAQITRRRSEYDRFVGETLDGRYFVERKIGEGGMGVVFAVKHSVIERPLAIKVLKREVMRDNATVQRFIQEAKAASRIGHPNIVDVTDFGKTPEGMTYSVMEYIEGTTLSKTIKESAPLPAARAVRIAAQIARALAAAHGKGIVHRDLKPENVFLIDRDGRPDFVKIVDFGIAKVQPLEGAELAPRLTRAGAVFGTPEYMAPEQAAGRSDTDHRVDVYALGTILYEMLVGKVPHKGDSMIRTIAMQMLDPIVPPHEVNPDLDIPPALEAIVMKALAKKREERYQTMAELLAALEGLGALRTLAPVEPNHTPGRGVKGLITDAPPLRRAKPPTRPLHEPEFAAPGTPVSAGSVSFTHVYEAEEEPEPGRGRSRRWPMFVAGAIVLVLGAGGAVLLIHSLQKADKVAQKSTDAALVAEVHDAAVPPADAHVVVEVPADAAVAVVPARPDAGVATIGRPTNRMITVEIMTRPGDADVFIGRNYRGPSGVRITEAYGTKRKIECKTDRMKGSVEVVFDGKKDAVMCTAARDRFCVPGLKNPYDDCEEDPNGLTP